MMDYYTRNKVDHCNSFSKHPASPFIRQISVIIQSTSISYVMTESESEILRAPKSVLVGKTPERDILINLPTKFLPNFAMSENACETTQHCRKPQMTFLKCLFRYKEKAKMKTYFCQNFSDIFCTPSF